MVVPSGLVLVTQKPLLQLAAGSPGPGQRSRNYGQDTKPLKKRGRMQEPTTGMLYSQTLSV